MKLEALSPKIRNKCERIIRDAVTPSIGNVEEIRVFTFNSGRKQTYDLVENMRAKGFRVPANVYKHEHQTNETGKRVWAPTLELLANAATVVTLSNAEGRVLAHGTSFCSKSENNFDRNKGTIRALGRAIKALTAEDRNRK
jgi:hypothetical protein